MTFRIELADRKPDAFAIWLSSGYAAAGDVASGKLEIEQDGCADEEDDD